jgi:hypothetical protein
MLLLRRAGGRLYILTPHSIISPIRRYNLQASSTPQDTIKTNRLHLTSGRTCWPLSEQAVISSLTFWCRNYFLNFSTPCIQNSNNTGTKYVRIMKQTAF